MSRSVSNVLKNAANAANTSEAFLVLLTIEHASLAEPIRVTTDQIDTLSSGVKGVISNGVEYVGFPFEIILPDENENTLPRATLRLDNVDRTIVQAVRSITSAPDVTMQVVLASDPDTVEAEITNFQLRNVTANAQVVEGELTTTQYDEEPYPAGRFTPNGFGGLF